MGFEGNDRMFEAVAQLVKKCHVRTHLRNMMTGEPWAADRRPEVSRTVYL